MVMYGSGVATGMMEIIIHAVLIRIPLDRRQADTVLFVELTALIVHIIVVQPIATVKILSVSVWSVFAWQ